MKFGRKHIGACSGVAFFVSTLSAPLLAQDIAPRVFNTIEVQGNSRFSEGDILATSGLETGVPLGEQELRAAVDALDYTAEFDDIVITSQGDVLTIVVDETPNYSGGLTFGAGYDTDRGGFASIGLALSNLTEGGLQLRSDLIYAEDQQTLQFDTRSRNFWGEGVRGGVRGDFGRFKYDNVTYNFDDFSIEPYVTFDLAEKAAVELRYTLASTDIYNVSDTTSPIIAAEAGRQTSSGIGISFGSSASKIGNTPDFLDDWAFRFDQDFTGLGGDTKLAISQLSLSGRKDLGQNGFALRTRIEGGAVVGMGDNNDPRASDRFSLGGARLRGFERGTIAPTDFCAGCGADGADRTTILGGNYFFVARTDLLVPLFPANPSLETFVFYDAGSAWDISTDVAPEGVLNDGIEWRSSAGVGVSFDTDLGKFEAYYAPFTDGVETDVSQEFGLTFRTNF